MSHAVLPILLGAALASAVPAVHAGPEIAGAFVLEAIPLDGSPYPAQRNCLIVRSHRSRPMLLHFGGVGACGVDGNAPVDALIWDIAPVVASNGRTAHLLRHRASGKCLVRGPRHPTLHRWPGTRDPRWCGLPSADALIDNARAAWRFDHIEVDDPAGRHIAALRIEQGTPLFLAFDQGAEGAADFAEEPDVGTMFRLTPVASP